MSLQGLDYIGLGIRSVEVVYLYKDKIIGSEKKIYNLFIILKSVLSITLRTVPIKTKTFFMLIQTVVSILSNSGNNQCNNLKYQELQTKIFTTVSALFSEEIRSFLQ